MSHSDNGDIGTLLAIPWKTVDDEGVTASSGKDKGIGSFSSKFNATRSAERPYGRVGITIQRCYGRHGLSQTMIAKLPTTVAGEPTRKAQGMLLKKGITNGIRVDNYPRLAVTQTTCPN